MGRNVGGYALEEELGHGAMATVFRARASDGTPVALRPRAALAGRSGVAALIGMRVPQGPARQDQATRLASEACRLAPEWGAPFLRRGELFLARGFPRVAVLDLERGLGRELAGVDLARFSRLVGVTSRAMIAGHPEQAWDYLDRFRAALARLAELGVDRGEPAGAALRGRLEEKR